MYVISPPLHKIYLVPCYQPERKSQHIMSKYKCSYSIIIIPQKYGSHPRYVSISHLKYAYRVFALGNISQNMNSQVVFLMLHGNLRIPKWRYEASV